MTASINPLDQFELGIGTYAWGDRMVWGYGKGTYTDTDLEKAFQVCLEKGIKFFDTAEVYGSGHAERLLGELHQKYEDSLFVASKFMPFPWRLKKNSLLAALKNSLERLKIKKMDLYQIHWPIPPVGVETWMEALAQAKSEGLIENLGVSNYNPDLTKCAQERLEKIGFTLTSNQVEYHLLNRQIERNGLLEYCSQNGIKIIAYSPLAQGILTGKYTPENPPQGVRGQRNNRTYLQRIKPLILALKAIGEDHDGKTPAQVAINWTICKGTLPIPGVKNAEQADQNAGSIGWRLTEEEIDRLDQISARVASG